MNIQQQLNDKIQHAMRQAGADDEASAVVRQSSKAQFGDYQANGVIATAKKQAKNPREFAQSVIDKLDIGDMVKKVEVAGAGFINIFLCDDWLATQATNANRHANLGIERNQHDTIVVDYSSPNVAKEMHVGHLRSTIIGDSVVRTLEFLGNRVIRANHVGDWGTQFGMLIAYFEKMEQENTADMMLADIENFYRQAKHAYDNDEHFAQKARNYVVQLQNGDEHCLALWRKLVDMTMAQCQATYERLHVSLSPQDTMAESLYNPMLPSVVQTLKDKGLAVVDDGAVVVFLDEFQNKDGEPMGVIVQKQDGGYLYTTTDIAAAHYRYQQLGADRVLLFTDARQTQHIQQAWHIARLAALVPDDFVMQHFTFGMMLGKDGKPFKTRTGGTVKLNDLLDEAIERATLLIDNKAVSLNDDEKQAVIEAVAIGAVKYADLSKNRNTDYVFDWDNMLSFEGNTAPYMQYAYTRIRSIFARADNHASLDAPIVLSVPQERTLVVKLLQFEEVLLLVAKDGLPHLLCQYLFELAGAFSGFYERCPILSADEPIRQSRLALANLTAKTLKQGLDLLGIQTVEKM